MLWIDGPLAVMSVLVTVAGMAAVGTGWVLPWLRKKVCRRRLWGCGSLLLAACCAYALFDGPRMMHIPFGNPASAGSLISLAMMWAAQRPTRAVTPPSIGPEADPQPR